MRHFLRCLLDPYLHLLVIGAALIRLATAGGPEPTEFPIVTFGICDQCGTAHDESKPCPALVVPFALARRQ